MVNQKGRRSWIFGAISVLIFALILSNLSYFTQKIKSCDCNNKDSRKYTGLVEDCCCDYETVDILNKDVLNPLLQDLVTTPFFRYFKAKLWCDCPFWLDDGMCHLRDCSVCECPESEFPEPFKKPFKNKLSSDDLICQEGKPEATVDRTLDSNAFRGWVDIDNPWTNDDETDNGEMTYVNLQLNPERYTGYAGPSARRIWDAIYTENCPKFVGTANSDVDVSSKSNAEAESTKDSTKNVKGSCNDLPKIGLNSVKKEEEEQSSVPIPKTFVGTEIVYGKTVNVVEGLKLYGELFDSSKISSIIHLTNELRSAGRRGQLKGHTFMASKRPMKGRGREVIQLGAPVADAAHEDERFPRNYEDSKVEAMPSLLEDVIDRLVGSQVVPVKPDSCVIDFFNEVRIVFVGQHGLRALLRFMTGVYVCLNRGDVDPAAKQRSVEAAGCSLVSIAVDHIFLCIKDADFRIELLMQSLFFSRV